MKLLRKMKVTSVDEIRDNEWSRWGAEIDKQVDQILNEVGDRDNAHYFPTLAKRLLQDIAIFPLSSNVCHDNFGYGRVPASSASVEGEFNKLKNCLLKNYSVPMRVDVFLKIHLDYLRGKLKIVDAEKQNDLVTSLDTASNEECDIKKNKRKTKNMSQDINILFQNNQPKLCTACNNGDVPSGAHICILCKVAVHAIEECSLTYGEEGYGQERICLSCSSLEGSQNILASRETENWQGLILNNNTKRKAKYLGDDPRGIQDALTWRSAKLPIIKNGSSTELQAIKIRSKLWLMSC